MNNSTLTPEIFTNSTHYTGPTDIGTICVYVINILLGFTTHSYVIWLIVQGTNGVASEFFNLNLSVCEIGNALNCLFFIVSNCISSMKILPQFLLGLVFTGRPLFQCLMCVERYLAVVHPVTFLKYKPLRYRLICCAAAWIITLGVCLFCFYKGQTHRPFLSLQFFPFLFIQLFCLVAVLRALKQSGPGDRKREKDENHMKRRAFFLILITTVNITITYVPFSITALVIILTNQNIYALWIIGLICYVLTGFVQPVLYLQRIGKLSHLYALYLQYFVVECIRVPCWKIFSD